MLSPLARPGDGESNSNAGTPESTLGRSTTTYSKGTLWALAIGCTPYSAISYRLEPKTPSVSDGLLLLPLTCTCSINLYKHNEPI